MLKEICVSLFDMITRLPSAVDPNRRWARKKQSGIAPRSARNRPGL